jgi:small GTP-binding protein
MVNVTEVKRKLCLIGDWGVGKTSLVRRFVNNSFDDRYFETVGTKVIKKRIKYEKDGGNIIDLNLLIWDIMGQKEFIRTQELAFHGAQGAIIVCDITRKETLENLCHWQQTLFEVAGPVPTVILANKNDLINNAKFCHKEFCEVCEQLKAPSYSTSAKTGENVEDAFRKIGSELIAKY